MSSDFLQNQPHFSQNCIFLAKTGWFGRNWLVLQMVLFGYCGSVILRCRISVSAETGKPRFGRTLNIITWWSGRSCNTLRSLTVLVASIA